MYRYVGCLLALLLLPLGGCVDDGVSMRVECNIAPDEECFFDASDNNPICRGSGSWDLGLYGGQPFYVKWLQIRNALFPRKQEIPVTAEPNGLQIRGASVTLTTTGGAPLPTSAAGEANPLPNPYSIVAGGYVAPEGVSAVSFVAVPAGYGQWLLDNRIDEQLGTIVINMKVNAITNGGVELQSDEWRWPVALGFTNPQTQQTCRTLDAMDDDTDCLPGQDGSPLPICP